MKCWLNYKGYAGNLIKKKKDINTYETHCYKLLDK